MGRAEDLFARLETDRESAIDELIATRQSEELFLDFKRSSDNGAGVRLSQADRNNLSKAVSGFGNSEGGVIVWGVDCSQDSSGADLPRFTVPLADAARFVSWLEGAVSGTTIPPHSMVRSVPLGQSFAATLVQKSDRAPHQSTVTQQYYIRAGSSFVPTPHGVLAGMFGRRPQPNVFHTFLVSRAQIDAPRVHIDVGIMVRNQGPGVARDVYLNLLFVHTAEGGSQIGFELPDAGSWVGSQTFGAHTSIITKTEVRLPPESHLHAVRLRVTLRPPFKSGVLAHGIVGAGSSPPHRFTFDTPRDLRDLLEKLYTDLLAAHGTGTLTDAMLLAFPRQVLGSEEDRAGGEGLA